MVNVAINGFGRIGRLVLRAGIKDLKIVAINDLGDINTSAHLLKFDSVHGKFNGKVSVKSNDLIVNNKKIKYFSESDPEKLPWKQLKIDFVVDCTGVFRTKELLSKHIKAGAKKVILSAPPKDSSVKTFVLGVNEKTLSKDDTIISNASCTTNSLAPIVKILHENFGIVSGLMTTIHSYTNDQRILDLAHKDLRRARSAAINMIPTTTGAAKAVVEVIPELKGKLDGVSVRVPTANGSLTDFTAVLSRNITVKQVNQAIKTASERELRGILEYSEEDLVSTDIIGNENSSIFDSKMTKVVDGNNIKVFAWYDNEYGYSCRIIDLIKLISKRFK